MFAYWLMAMMYVMTLRDELPMRNYFENSFVYYIICLAATKIAQKPLNRNEKFLYFCP